MSLDLEEMEKIFAIKHAKGKRSNRSRHAIQKLGASFSYPLSDFEAAQILIMLADSHIHILAISPNSHIHIPAMSPNYHIHIPNNPSKRKRVAGSKLYEYVVEYDHETSRKVQRSHSYSYSCKQMQQGILFIPSSGRSQNEVFGEAEVLQWRTGDGDAEEPGGVLWRRRRLHGYIGQAGKGEERENQHKY